MGLGDPGKVLLKRAQNRTGLSYPASNVGKIPLEVFASVASCGVLLDLQVRENSTPYAPTIAQFLDKVSRCIQEMGLQVIHEFRG